MPKKISTDAMKLRDATLATVKSWLDAIEAIDGIEKFSAEVSFSRADHGRLYVRLRATMVHRTERGPARIGGHGIDFVMALIALREDAEEQNVKATARAERLEATCHRLYGRRRCTRKSGFGAGGLLCRECARI